MPPYYDSLLAKLICQGRDRAEAIARMHVALDGFIIEGVTTTIPFLARVMQNPAVHRGRGRHEVPRARDGPVQGARVGADRRRLRRGVADAADVAGRVVAVIDVLRASTSIAAALANGARAVIPLESSDEVVTRAKAFERTRRAARRRAADAPDSRVRPRQLADASSRARSVEGKTILMTTTNGTPAIANTAGRA